MSGPPTCGATCPLPRDTRGGSWWCSTNWTHPPTDFDSCHFSCGNHLVSTTCLAGQWDQDPGNAETFSCPCDRPPEGPQISCTSQGSPYPGGTLCASACAPDLVTTCDNGAWSQDLTTVTCQAAPGVMLMVTSILSFLTTILIVVRYSYAVFKYLRTRCHKIEPTHT